LLWISKNECYEGEIKGSHIEKKVTDEMKCNERRKLVMDLCLKIVCESECDTACDYFFIEYL
jgi:hypothetical protein